MLLIYWREGDKQINEQARRKIVCNPGTDWNLSLCQEPTNYTEYEEQEWNQEI